MINNIDVHILHKSNTKTPLEEVWWDECQQSMLNLPINIHQLTGSSGISEMMSNRERGFRMGNSEYVSFVDPDDVVHGNPFQDCVDAMEHDVTLCGVYTNSYVTYEGTDKPPSIFFNYDNWSPVHHITSKTPVHQVAVFKRKHIDTVFNTIKRLDLSTGSYSEVVIFTILATLGPWKLLSNNFGYTWRSHDSGLHHQYSGLHHQVAKNSSHCEIFQLKKRLLSNTYSLPKF
jgi:hypothetical protein